MALSDYGSPGLVIIAITKCHCTCIKSKPPLLMKLRHVAVIYDIIFLRMMLMGAAPVEHALWAYIKKVGS